MMIDREISTKILQLVDKFPVISLTGPRQSGKTTLLRALFPKYQYVSLEDPNQRLIAKEAPLSLLQHGNEGIIVDEAQYVPELFSYVQLEADERKENGKFVLSGSQHFLMMESISQSLAGRVALFNLLPFSLGEIHNGAYGEADVLEYMYKGMFPGIYDRAIEPTDFYPNYIQTYIERDARQIVNISDLGVFQNFIQLCAARAGQLFNQSELGNVAGIDQKTARKWLSILETGFQAFTLRPYFRNFNKRITKTPKLYFWDTGLLCSLLGIRSIAELQQHYARGAIFENFIIVELLKQFYNKGIRPNAYFWRDHSGHEIDLLIEQGAKLYPIEIKSSQVINSSFTKNLAWFSDISGVSSRESYVIYGGMHDFEHNKALFRSWSNLPDFTKM